MSEQKISETQRLQRVISKRNVRIKQLETENKELSSWKDAATNNPECIHCGSRDVSIDHWRRCEEHPANTEIAHLEAEREQLIKVISVCYGLTTEQVCKDVLAAVLSEPETESNTCPKCDSKETVVCLHCGGKRKITALSKQEAGRGTSS